MTGPVVACTQLEFDPEFLYNCPENADLSA